MIFLRRRAKTNIYITQFLYRVKLGNQYLYYTVPISSEVNLPSETVYFFSASLIASTTWRAI